MEIVLALMGLVLAGIVIARALTAPATHPRLDELSGFKA